MDKEDIVKYVMHTPANTNPAVLRSMLGSVEGGGGGNSPLIVHSTLIEGDEMYQLDRTFGEIRAAINAGQTVLILSAQPGPLESHDVDIVQRCTYTIGILAEQPAASGAVVISNRQYDVQCVSEPYTLAALDAQYPQGA